VRASLQVAENVADLTQRRADIVKDLKGSDQFPCVIEVTPGQDESAIVRVN
jgi:hypothetical protein